MKPSRRAVLAIVWVAGVMAVGLGVPLLVFQYGFGDLCANEIHARYPSPDGRRELVVFNRDCGATTGFSTQASLLDNGEELPDDSGNLFVADTNHGEAPTGELRVRWEGPRDLTLSHHEKCRVFQARNVRDGVRVRYVKFH